MNTVRAMLKRLICLWIATLPLLRTNAAAAEVSPQEMERGRTLYLRNCVICHQVTGMGMPGTFPPLAKSDFLMNERERSIRAVVEGMSGEITVNGKRYNGSMPPALLKDDEAAAVLNYARNSWGNKGEAITAEEVGRIRSKTQYPTYEALVAANAFQPLPKAPEGLSLRVVGNLPSHPTRLLMHPNGREVWMLGGGGDVWTINPTNGVSRQILRAKDYIDLKHGEAVTYGMTLDRSGRFYVVVNQRNERGAIVTNEVTIYRTATFDAGDPKELKPWFQTAYPWGVGPFNHCVGHIAQGPDGRLYVNSGSRTDGNEPGEDPRYAKIGEHELTACIWRLDPEQEQPKLAIHARGFRNAYGFCWDSAGRMIATDNGPDADAPEELNEVDAGNHYGFPYQYSDWLTKPYPHTPASPSGLSFRLPIRNNGPAAGYKDKPIYTFDPHSSPAGIVHLGRDWPESYRNSYFVVRFGNLLQKPQDVGFDLLQVKLESNRKPLAATITTVLAPLPRPIDIIKGGSGKVFIAEYSRPTNNAGSLGFPGRLLELSVAENGPKQ
ncbi:MAG TPA: c-type cytochrome [Methylomirabilota bacterium]|nr:c-type cytochrome [Methylomirabilota bacterium]